MGVMYIAHYKLRDLINSEGEKARKQSRKNNISDQGERPKKAD